MAATKSLQLHNCAMGHAAVDLRMSVEEFLAWDATQTQKHEFVGGEVFAMAGGEDRHATATLNLAVALRQHLRGSACRTYVNDVKLFVAADQSFYYPDVFVTCGSADAAQRLIKSEAKFVAEVLSPSTAAYDRGSKFASYRRLPTLQEYLLVDLDSRRCDLFRKGDDGLWVLHPFEPGQTLQLASVGLEIGAEQLFADVEPAAEPANPPASAH
jgi:Uma2 family endonuclease